MLPESVGPWLPWSHWSPCSVSCGGGQQSRTRLCNLPPCSGLRLQSKTCNTQVCLGEFSFATHLVIICSLFISDGLTVYVPAPSEVGCPPGRLYRECERGEGCPFSCAQVSGREGCYLDGCEEGCHCPMFTYQHKGACLKVRCYAHFGIQAFVSDPNVCILMKDPILFFSGFFSGVSVCGGQRLPFCTAERFCHTNIVSAPLKHL